MGVSIGEGVSKDPAGGIGVPGDGATPGSIATVGHDSTTSGSTIITGGSSAHTKGAYVELVASTPIDADYIIVALNEVDTADTLVDIATGAAASETIIANNLYVGGGIGSSFEFTYYTIPIAIPAGTRLSARSQSLQINDTSAALVYLISGGNVYTATTETLVTIGANVGSTRGTPIDPGTTINTKGSYIELIASTTSEINMFQLAFPVGGDGIRSNCNWLIDIAIGGAGSEVNIVSNYKLTCNAVGDTIMNTSSIIFPINIPNGSRISVRAQCSINTVGDRLFDVILYGME